MLPVQQHTFTQTLYAIRPLEVTATRKEEEKEMIGKIYYISPKIATEFLQPRHYSGRKPQISEAFGLYDCNGDEFGLPNISHLKAVCTFGKPASPSLCIGICGKEHSSSVYELNRLCRVDDWNEPLSIFVGACLRRLKLNNWIVVSYADSGMNHNGYIYQATNFLYTGKTKARTDKYTEGNKHSRHYSNDSQGEFRKVRTAKYRYVYFCTSNKRLKKEWKNKLNYPILPYPKEENKNYRLGEYQLPLLVKNQNARTAYNSRLPQALTSQR